MWSQVGLRKLHYKQSKWRWWNSSWAISNPERWRYESAALNMPKIWKTQQWPQEWKRSVFISISKKGNAKECSNNHTIGLISQASKVMLKILQARLGFNSMWTPNFQMFKLNLGKAEEPKIKQENSRKKKSIVASLTMLKALTVWITTNCGKFFKRWEYQTTYLPPEKCVCRSRINS